MHPTPNALPEIRTIQLANLDVPETYRSILTSRQRACLTRSIEQTGQYPPLTVTAGQSRGRFTILDGLARYEALQAMGATEARCDVWDVSPERAELVRLALNRIRGRADGRARAKLVARLNETMDLTELALVLATGEQTLRGWIKSLERPAALKPRRLLNLEPVVFHLPAEDARTLGKLLREGAAGKLGRARALMSLVRNSA